MLFVCVYWNISGSSLSCSNTFIIVLLNHVFGVSSRSFSFLVHITAELVIYEKNKQSWFFTLLVFWAGTCPPGLGLLVKIFAAVGF